MRLQCFSENQDDETNKKIELLPNNKPEVKQPETAPVKKVKRTYKKRNQLTKENSELMNNIIKTGSGFKKILPSDSTQQKD